MSSGEDSRSDRPTRPISEVVSEQTNEHRAEITPHEENSDSSDKWRLLFEMQNSNMKALIEALSKPQRSTKHVTLPEFDPDKTDADARSWCATSDLCFADNPMEGGQLIVTISKALKGTASAWLSTVSYPGMAWADFKELFIARFVSIETPAGTLIKLSTDKPKEGETLAAYGSRVMSLLFNQWKNLTVEQIVVATTVAHISQFDSRLQRMAFTSELNDRQRLQQELRAFTYLKRKSSSVPDQKMFENKHISTRCPNGGSAEAPRSERRVDVYLVDSPAGTLYHQGQSFSFYFDSAAE